MTTDPIPGATAHMKLAEIDLEDDRCRQAFARLFDAPVDEAEDWRYVVTPDFTSSDYIVSDRGRVVSLPRYRKYGAGSRSRVHHRKFLPGAVLRPGLQPSGHQTIVLSHNKELFKTHVHRLVTWAFLGPQPAMHHVRHLDGDSSNNRLDNLAYATPWSTAADLSARDDGQAGGVPITVTPSLELRITAALRGDDDPLGVLEEIRALLGRRRTTVSVERKT